MYKQFLKQFHLETGPTDTHTHTQIPIKRCTSRSLLLLQLGREDELREENVAGYLAAFTWLDDRTFPEHQAPKNRPGQPNPEEARRGDLP